MGHALEIVADLRARVETPGEFAAVPVDEQHSDAGRGVINPRDKNWLDGALQSAIEGNIEAIHLAEDLRAVPIRSAPAEALLPDAEQGRRH